MFKLVMLVDDARDRKIHFEYVRFLGFFRKKIFSFFFFSSYLRPNILAPLIRKKEIKLVWPHIKKHPVNFQSLLIIYLFAIDGL